jgi:tRNA pseudouridine38-40 synthase
VGASRTDAGVHARGQVAHLDYDGPVPPENMKRALNHRLATDVAIRAITQVSDRFHATRGAIGKLYRYRLLNQPDRPADLVRLRQAWHVWHSLDYDRMQAAAAFMVGTHDFAGFATQGSPRETTVRTVWAVTVRPAGDEVQIGVTGDGFLYNQVRNMVGTLIEIGRGRWEPRQVLKILDTADRRHAGPTAPARGLCLEKIRYPGHLLTGAPCNSTAVQLS